MLGKTSSKPERHIGGRKPERGKGSKQETTQITEEEGSSHKRTKNGKTEKLEASSPSPLASPGGEGFMGRS